MARQLISPNVLVYCLW